jgi:hypothetical protein
MDRAQANALLLLISDLARVLYAPPDVTPEPVHENGQAREPVTST